VLNRTGGFGPTKDVRLVDAVKDTGRRLRSAS
jgi:hypothetical protein